MAIDNESDQVNNSNNEPDYSDLTPQLTDEYIKCLKNTDNFPDMNKTLDMFKDVISTSETFKTTTSKLSEAIANSTSGFFNDIKILSDISEHISHINIPINIDISAITDLIIALQPKVFESVGEIADQILSTIDTKPFIKNLEPLLEITRSARFNIILEKTQWPLYCIDNQKMLEDISLLDEETDESILASNVCRILYKYLDDKWVDEIKDLWKTLQNISQEERILLECALECHKNGYYAGCVSILICLMEVFVQRYGMELYDFAYSHNDIFQERKDYYKYEWHEKPKNDMYMKQYLIIISTRFDYNNSSWQHSLDYIFNIIFTNDKNGLFINHHPLRNSICHGEQTNYGTWEHSIKAILVIDMLLNMGSVLFSDSSN